MKILRYAAGMFICTGLVLSQDATQGMEISALKSRVASEKEQLKVNKDRESQLKKELDDLKNKIKVQEDNIKLIEKRIKNDEKLAGMKK